MGKIIPISELNHIEYSNADGSRNPRNTITYIVIGQEVFFVETDSGSKGRRESVRDHLEEVICAIMAHEPRMDGEKCRFYYLELDGNPLIEEIKPIWTPDCTRPAKVSRHPTQYTPERIERYFADLISGPERKPIPVQIRSMAEGIYRRSMQPMATPGKLLDEAA